MEREKIYEGIEKIKSRESLPTLKTLAEMLKCEVCMEWFMWICNQVWRQKNLERSLLYSCTEERGVGLTAVIEG